jgi:hypothetical protein
MSLAFKQMVAEWERSAGREATFADMERMLLDTLASVGVYPDADGMSHRADIDRAFDEIRARSRR